MTALDQISLLLQRFEVRDQMHTGLTLGKLESLGYGGSQGSSQASLAVAVAGSHACHVPGEMSLGNEFGQRRLHGILALAMQAGVGAAEIVYQAVGKYQITQPQSRIEYLAEGADIDYPCPLDEPLQ